MLHTDFRCGSLRSVAHDGFAELRQPGDMAGIEDGDVEQEGKKQDGDDCRSDLPPG